MSHHALRNISLALTFLVALALVARFAIGRLFNPGAAPPGTIQKVATSKDGTLIAYEQSGTGPVVILVSAALADKNGARPLARELTPNFTVINYDRRGRGNSTNNQPYAEDREVEDLEALVNAAGAPVLLFGSSSGSVLALDAASHLGPKVKKLFLYEPPFIVDASHPPIPDSLRQEIGAAVSANNRDQATALFFGKGMGIPAPGITFMRLFMPAWNDMTKIAHTAPYDLEILAGTQSGKPLPANRWNSTTAPAIVAVGAKSEPFFHSGAKALVTVLSSARYQSLDNLDHSAVLIAPKPLADALRRFFADGQP